ncbi:hypothetical protein [Poseidonocella sp. HB161398]|uniref:hypothetical protein n=1 Tax=Poseidonocella sp. HB161398 TaxID=2320855 RepID=UPI001109F400|nr:hypothetical protein [Poseidonocella sp. HB161398]
MTGMPIDLDRHRTTADRLKSRLRRNTANLKSPPPQVAAIEIEAASERTLLWSNAMTALQALKEQCAAEPGRCDPKSLGLITQAMADLDRLRPA